MQQFKRNEEKWAIFFARKGISMHPCKSVRPNCLNKLGPETATVQNLKKGIYIDWEHAVFLKKRAERRWHKMNKRKRKSTVGYSFKFSFKIIFQHFWNFMTWAVRNGLSTFAPNNIKSEEGYQVSIIWHFYQNSSENKKYT